MTTDDSNRHNGYDDAKVAQSYDAENSGRHDIDFYLDLAAELSGGDPGWTVLDIGCGTGVLATDMVRAGHRAIGVDPAGAMLDVARERPDGDRVTWIHGNAADAPDSVADLAVMSGHVAQYFLSAADWDDLLHHAHRALRPGGHLAFESRNPGNRAWERWTKENTLNTYPHPDGAFTKWVEVVKVDEDDPEGVIETHRSVSIYPHETRTGSGETLRFRPLSRLLDSLAAAGFEVIRSYGDFSRGPITDTSVEHILIARRS